MLATGALGALLGARASPSKRTLASAPMPQPVSDDNCHDNDMDVDVQSSPAVDKQPLPKFTDADQAHAHVAQLSRKRATASPFASALTARRSRRLASGAMFAAYPQCLYPSPPLPFLAPRSHIIAVVEPFTFNTPSPDDLVLAAQAQSKNFKQPSTGGATALVKTGAAGKGAAASPAKPASAASGGKLANGKLAVASVASLPHPPSPAVDAIATSVAELGLGSQFTTTSASSAAASSQSTPAVSKKRVDVAAEAAKRPAHLNLVIVGHVDAGKSTLTGHLLVQVGSVSDKMVAAYQRESQRQGKGSFAFAWVMDQVLGAPFAGTAVCGQGGLTLLFS